MDGLKLSALRISGAFSLRAFIRGALLARPSGLRSIIRPRLGFRRHCTRAGQIPVMRHSLGRGVDDETRRGNLADWTSDWRMLTLVHQIPAAPQRDILSGRDKPSPWLLSMPEVAHMRSAVRIRKRAKGFLPGARITLDYRKYTRTAPGAIFFVPCLPSIYKSLPQTL